MTSHADEIRNLRATLLTIAKACEADLMPGGIADPEGRDALVAVREHALAGLKTQRASIIREVPAVTKEHYDTMCNNALRLMTTQDDLAEAMALGIEAHLADLRDRRERDVPELVGPLAAWRAHRPTPGLVQ